MSQKVLEDIVQDLKDYSQNVVKFSAIEAREELYKTAQEAIDYFYATYTPGDYYQRKAEFLINNGNNEIPETSDFVYTRHSPIGQNLKRSIKKWYHENHNKVYSGGIVLAPEFMADIYRGSRELIFDLVYSGYHGLDSFLQPFRPAAPFGITDPSPMQIIEDKAEEIQTKPDAYINNAVTRAKKEKYKYI